MAINVWFNSHVSITIFSNIHSCMAALTNFIHSIRSILSFIWMIRMNFQHSCVFVMHSTKINTPSSWCTRIRLIFGNKMSFSFLYVAQNKAMDSRIHFIFLLFSGSEYISMLNSTLALTMRKNNSSKISDDN